MQMAQLTADVTNAQDSILSNNLDVNGGKVLSDSINGSTQIDRTTFKGSLAKGTVGEREMTTGWQFATQIEDEEIEEVGKTTDETIKEAEQLIKTLDKEEQLIQPSMLDPRFEDDVSLPKTPMLPMRNTFQRSMPMVAKSIDQFTKKDRYNGDYQIDSYVPQSALLKSVGNAP